jgi:hypothetical protein
MIIPFANIIKRKPLPQDDSELCTKMNIVLIGDFKVSGSGDGDGLPMFYIDTEPHDYLPAPITIEAEHVDHADWRHEKVAAIDPNLDVFMRPDDIGVIVYTDFDVSPVGAASVELALRDEGTTSYVELDAVGAGTTGEIRIDDSTNAFNRRIVGVKFCYEATLATPNSGKTLYARVSHLNTRGNLNSDALTLGISDTPGADNIRSQVLVSLKVENTIRVIQWVYFPYHALQSAEFSTGQLVFDARFEINGEDFAAVTDFKLFYFYPLIVDTDRLQDYAESFINLPTPIPQSVEVLGYVQGDGTTATITGYPGGDQTLEVRQITRYPSRSPTGTTVIDLGALSDEVRKQKFFKEKQKSATQSNINMVAGGSRVKY